MNESFQKNGKERASAYSHEAVLIYYVITNELTNRHLANEYEYEKVALNRASIWIHFSFNDSEMKT